MSELIIDKITTRDGSNVGAVVVSDIDELLLLNTNKEINTTAIVKDSNRGGVFNYDGAQSGVNNGGTIFDGWVRQYDGAVNVKWFGAVGDGVTDDTTVIQNTITYASISGGSVYVPKGTYPATSLQMVSNVNMYGDGYDSILLRKDLTATNILMNIFGVDNIPANNIKGIKVSNLHLRGKSTDKGLGNVDEGHHLVMVQGGTNISFDNCTFTNWEGVAVAVRAGNNGWFNKNVTITNCIFDGEIKYCQNAIAVLSVDKMLIDNNRFYRCTAPDQPAAIDIEPNPQDASYAELFDITISNNQFDDIGGNVGAICMYLPIAFEDFNYPPKNITIRNNTIKNSFAGIVLKQHQTSDASKFFPESNIKIEGNYISNTASVGLWLYGLKGVTVNNNTFEDTADSARVGWTTDSRAVYDVSFSRNTFRRCGTTSGIGLGIYRSAKIFLDANDFIDCGVSNGTYGVGIDFSSGNTEEVALTRNWFQSPEGKTTAAITANGGEPAEVITSINSNNFGGFEYTLSATLEAGMLTASTNLHDSIYGQTFIMSNVNGFTITLPLPQLGRKVKFINGLATTAAYRIVTKNSANIIYGCVGETTDAVASQAQGADIVAFGSASAVGDWAEFISDGVKWYLQAVTQANYGISIATT